MGLFKIKNSLGEEPLKWIMNRLREMKQRVSARGKIQSEEGKQVGSVLQALFWWIPRAGALGEGEISKSVCTVLITQRPNTKQTDSSGQWTFIRKRNQLCVQFSIWLLVFKLWGKSLYLAGNRGFAGPAQKGTLQAGLTSEFLESISVEPGGARWSPSSRAPSWPGSARRWCLGAVPVCGTGRCSDGVH